MGGDRPRYRLLDGGMVMLQAGALVLGLAVVGLIMLLDRGEP